MNRNVFVLLVGVFLMSGVFGLGVSPARTTLDFEPGMTKEVSFDVINSGEGAVDFVFLAQGDLKDYISSVASSGSFLAGEKSKSFSYTLNLPESLGPGLHVGEIVVMEIPGDNEEGGAQVLATLAVVTQIYIYVPYPGKHANAKLYVYSAALGEPIRFVIPVASVGDFDLTSVRAKVDIHDETGGKVDSFDIDAIEIKSGTQKELVYDWKKDVLVGDYIALATVIYDEGTVSLEEKFRVGRAKLELQEVRVDDFNLGDIVKLEMLVENKWSSQINDVLINTTIYNDRGGVVSAIKSSDYNVGAFSKEVFVSYWDTAGVLEGEYDAQISIEHDDEESKNNLKFDVSKNELVVIGLGYVISEAEGDGGDYTLWIIVGLLVLMNIIWFWILRKKLKK